MTKTDTQRRFQTQNYDRSQHQNENNRFGKMSLERQEKCRRKMTNRFRKIQTDGELRCKTIHMEWSFLRKKI